MISISVKTAYMPKKFCDKNIAYFRCNISIVHEYRHAPLNLLEKPIPKRAIPQSQEYFIVRNLQRSVDNWQK